MENELLKYLTEEEKKSIAERVFEEEIRKSIVDDISKRTPEIYHDKKTVYDNILYKYISEMDLYHDNFIGAFKERALSDIKSIIDDPGSQDENDHSFRLRQVVDWRVRDITEEVINESKEELKPIIKDKVFRCCNETLLIAFLSDIVRGMKLNDAVKKIIQESEGNKI